MRTTITIDDKAMEIARAQAAARGVSLGRVISDAVMRSRLLPLSYHLVNGLPVLDLPPDTPTITMEEVKRLDEESW